MMIEVNTRVDTKTPSFVRNGVTLSQVDVVRAERRLALAIWKAEHNQPEVVPRLFEEALSLSPANVTFRMEYVVFLAQQEDWTAAKRELAQAVTDDAATSAAWLDNGLASTPSDTSLLHLQALLLTRLGRHAEAQVAFEQLLTIAPGHGQTLFDQATLLDVMDEWEAADRSYRAALDADPSHVTWLTAYGTFLERCEREKEALSFLERGLEIRPDDVSLQERVRELRWRVNQKGEAYRQAARAKLMLEDQNDVDGAAVLVAEALRIAPECALVNRVQAAVLIRKGSLVQAEAHLVRAVELEPDNPEYQAALLALQAEIEPLRQHARYLVSQARAVAERETACTLLDKALVLITNDVDAHVAYAELLWPDRPYEVEKHLQAALAVAPQHLEANRQYAILLYEQGRGLEAERYFLAVLAKRPHDEELLDKYTGLLIEQGRYQEAVNLLQAALPGLPTSARLQGRLATAWARLGRLAEALPQFEAALQMEPQNAMLHREYAVALRDAGQRAMAEDHFRTALALKRDDAVTHREYAALLMAQQRYFKAWDRIQQARALCPYDEKILAEAKAIEESFRQFEQVEAEVAYAVWLSRQKAPEKIASARETFDRAMRLDPNSIMVLEEYAIFLEHQGELVRARNMLGRALEIVPEDQKIQDVLRDLSPSVLPDEPPPPLEDVLRDLSPSVLPDEPPPPLEDVLRDLSPSVLPDEPLPPLEDVLRDLSPSVLPDEPSPPPPETEAPKSLLERLADFVRRSVRRQP